MKIFYRILPLIFLLFTLTSCIELIDDVTLNSDGSGSFKYSLNLSSSKTKVSSLLALDSLDGKKIPSRDELKSKIVEFEKTMSTQPDITNVKVESNWEDYIFKFSCDFNNLLSLQQAFKKSIETMKWSNVTICKEQNWIHWSNSCLVRDIPEFSNTFFNSSYVKEDDLLFGKYTSITRFDKEVVSFENTNSQLSKTKKAVMTQTNLKSLIEDQSKLDNKICF